MYAAWGETNRWWMVTMLGLLTNMAHCWLRVRRMNVSSVTQGQDGEFGQAYATLLTA